MKILLERLDQLASVTDEPGSICRTFLSPAMRRANELVGGWMKEAGAEVSVDGWGNLIGHFPGAEPQAPTLLLGSHLDTVRNAGKFDGPLGVLVAIAAMQVLSGKKVSLPFHVDVLGFSDEEGVRFHSAYLGSQALIGGVKESDLDFRDANRITLREAVTVFQGAANLELPAPRYQPDRLLGYVEVHIEQGPVLQEKGLALGVVDHIAAQNRFSYNVSGSAGHAGTTPMMLRQDALAGAAEWILEVEKTALRTEGLVATVGQLTVAPGASNVIPDQVRLSLDIRHANDDVLARACSHLEQEAQAIALRRHLKIEAHLVQGGAPVACAPALIEKLDRSVATIQKTVPHLVSGAGHDAVILSRLTPVAMLFVRCRNGLSHHPDEHADEADMAAACQAITHFLENFHD